jgi:assimilatory nitrate reductase catalytic subunit
VLNTGRIRDQWHTMTRTGLAPRLSSHIAEPFVQIHPVDAAAHGLGRGGIAELTSRWGRMLARIEVDADQRPGSVFVPMHWSDMLARRARADALVNPVTDPVSGQPEFKHTPVQVSLFRAAWYGIVLSRERLLIPDGMTQDATGTQPDYCVAIREQGFWRTEIAGREPIADWADRARDLFGADGEWLDFADVAHGRYRGARILDGRLAACLFIAPTPNLPSSRWLGELFGAAQLDTQRPHWSARRPTAARPSRRRGDRLRLFQRGAHTHRAGDPRRGPAVSRSHRRLPAGRDQLRVLSTRAGSHPGANPRPRRGVNGERDRTKPRTERHA